MIYILLKNNVLQNYYINLDAFKKYLRIENKFFES